MRAKFPHHIIYSLSAQTLSLRKQPKFRDATTGSESSAAAALFQLRLHIAFSTILLAIDSAQLYSVTSCEQPKQAWNALKNHVERETLAKKLFLKKQYFRAEMKEGTFVDQHSKYMKDITDKLAAIGAPVWITFSKHSYTTK